MPLSQGKSAGSKTRHCAGGEEWGEDGRLYGRLYGKTNRKGEWDTKLDERRVPQAILYSIRISKRVRGPRRNSQPVVETAGNEPRTTLATMSRSRGPHLDRCKTRAILARSASLLAGGYFNFTFFVMVASRGENVAQRTLKLSMDCQPVGTSTF